MLVIPNSKTWVTFTLHGSEFIKTLKIVMGIFKAGSEFFLSAEKGKLYLLASDKAKVLRMEVPADSLQGEGCFIFDPQLLVGVFNHRAELSLEITYSGLKFKSVRGKYSGDLRIEPASDAVSYLNEYFTLEVDAKKLPEDFFKTLEKAIHYCNLTDSYSESDQELVRYITGKENHLKIFTYDQFHSALLTLTTDSSVDEEFKIAVYQSYFTAINNLSRGFPVSVALSDTYFYVQGKDFFLSLPPMQIDEEEYQSAESFIQDILNEDKAGTIHLDISDLEKVLSNVFSVYESGARIEVKFAEDTMKFSVATDRGKLSDWLKVATKGKGAFALDAPPIKDILKIAPKEVPCTLEYLEDRAYLLRFSGKKDDFSLAYIVSVLQ